MPTPGAVVVPPSIDVLRIPENQEVTIALVTGNLKTLPTCESLERGHLRRPLNRMRTGITLRGVRAAGWAAESVAPFVLVVIEDHQAAPRRICQ